MYTNICTHSVYEIQTKRTFRAINIGMSDENILHTIFLFADKLQVTRV